MYALCILAAINLRQHVQQNWQINSTATKRLPSQISLNLLKCFEVDKVPRKTENLRKDLKNNVKVNNEDNDQTIWRSSWFYFRKFIKDPRQTFSNINESITLIHKMNSEV